MFTHQNTVLAVIQTEIKNMQRVLRFLQARSVGKPGDARGL